jgi:SAM-dependent methyltransferase
MPLTPEDLERQKAHFADRTARFVAAGSDRFGAPEFILDTAGAIEGPVLDVGTGMGLTARALAARGFDVVSVDTNPDDQQMAECLTTDPELRRRIGFRLADAARLPFPAGHFGSAVVVDVLHHLDAGGPVLTELQRVVRPGGRIVLADFSAEGFEMVARVHASEGHTHPEGPVTMDWARGFLGGLGMTALEASGDRFHRIALFQAPPAVLA